MVRQTSIMLLVLFCFVYPMISYGVSIVVNTTYSITVTDRIMEKKNVSIYRRRLSMIEKLRTFFFP